MPRRPSNWPALGRRGSSTALAGMLARHQAQPQALVQMLRELQAQLGWLLFSDNVTDRLLGSEALMAEPCRRLGVVPDEVSADGLASVARTSCTGLGDQGPALLVNHHQVGTRLDSARVA